jgi:hypothetical protein
MLKFNRYSKVLIAAAAMAVTVPVVSSLAQDAPPAGRGGRGAAGGAAQPAGPRSEGDRALINPYAVNQTWYAMPKGRYLGSASAIDIDKDGTSVWVAERCGGQDLCAGSNVNPVFRLNAAGRITAQFGADMISYPHGIHIDSDGNVWVADLQSNTDNAARAGRGKPAASAASAPAPVPPPPGRRLVGLLEVRVDGAAREIAAEFEQALEQHLDTTSYWLAGRSQMRARMQFATKWVDGCVSGPCLAEVRTQTGAELVVLAVITGSGTSFGYAVTIVRTDNGRVLAQESSRCDVCMVKEAMTEATLATLRLLNAVPERLPDEAAELGAQIDMAVGKLERRLDARERTWARRGGRLAMVGLAVAAAGVGLYVSQDRPDWALVMAAAGGGLGVGGLVVLTF